MVIQKKITKNNNRHQFAFYLEALVETFLSVNQTFKISDKDLAHRISRVLRLSVGDEIVLFNREKHYDCELIDIKKQEVVVSIVSCEENKILTPAVAYLLPLLKKDALQEAIYSLVEVGVTKIQLVVTAKSRQKIKDKEFQRLLKIMVAAAEQSKHYAIPELHSSQMLLKCVEKSSKDQDKVIFDVRGSSFFKIRKELTQSEICLLAGPEGGLTSNELNVLHKYNFKSCVLTPTILRAVQAIPLSAALFRLQ